MGFVSRLLAWQLLSSLVVKCMCLGHVRCAAGDVAGAWRALDTDLSGSITLQDH